MSERNLRQKYKQAWRKYREGDYGYIVFKLNIPGSTRKKGCVEGLSVISSALTPLCKQVSRKIFKEDLNGFLPPLIFALSKQACYPLLYTKTIKGYGKHSSGVQNKIVPAIFGYVPDSRKCSEKAKDWERRKCTLYSTVIYLAKSRTPDLLAEPSPPAVLFLPLNLWKKEKTFGQK